MRLIDESRVGWRYAHEILFSLNISFFVLTLLFAADSTVSSFFSRLESSINVMLGIRQTDFVRGYVAILVPVLGGALLLWGVLRLASQTAIAREILRVWAGLVALFAVPAFWALAVRDRGFPYQGVPVELAAILICTIAFLKDKLRIPLSIGFLLLAAHYAFYWFVVGGQLHAPNYAGPIAPVMSLCSAVLWVLYVRQEKEPTPVPTSGARSLA